MKQIVEDWMDTDGCYPPDYVPFSVCHTWVVRNNQGQLVLRCIDHGPVEDSMMGERDVLGWSRMAVERHATSFGTVVRLHNDQRADQWLYEYDGHEGW